MNNLLQNSAKLLQTNNTNDKTKGLNMLCDFLDKYLKTYFEYPEKDFETKKKVRKRIVELYNEYGINYKDNASTNEEIKAIELFFNKFNEFETFLRKHKKNCKVCTDSFNCSDYIKKQNKFLKYLNQKYYSDFFIDIFRIILHDYYDITHENIAKILNEFTSASYSEADETEQQKSVEAGRQRYFRAKKRLSANREKNDKKNSLIDRFSMLFVLLIGVVIIVLFQTGIFRQNVVSINIDSIEQNAIENIQKKYFSEIEKKDSLQNLSDFLKTENNSFNSLINNLKNVVKINKNEIAELNKKNYVLNKYQHDSDYELILSPARGYAHDYWRIKSYQPKDNSIFFKTIDTDILFEIIDSLSVPPYKLIIRDNRRIDIIKEIEMNKQTYNLPLNTLEKGLYYWYFSKDGEKTQEYHLYIY